MHAGMGPQDEAERWFVCLLEPDCSDAERAAFERWHAASPAHALAYREVERLWEQGADAVLDPAVMAAAERALWEAPPESRRRVRQWFVPAFAIAAMVLLALLVVPRWRAAHMTIPETRYATVTGQQHTVNLKDGSSIVLDTDTVLIARYDASVRRIDLLRGQAQFHVHGNKSWPFVVHVQHGTVTAVGTKFQVRVNDAATTVTLLEGKLAIATTAGGQSQHASLGAAEQLQFNQEGVISPVHHADMEAAEGWTAGKLFVHDWFLPDLLAEMNRYSTTRLRIVDPSLRHVRISGAFHTDDQQALLLALEQGWSIHAERVSPVLIELSRK
ncbi:FecR family protein [Rhodanobacter sp. Col0626]|uniref:FecR family protein n=1 Tax=Rhodanobacter sp. Col0626 TaxID=3415679 RepID=UPI003CF99E6F